MKLRNNGKGDLILGGWPVLGKDGRADFITETIHMPVGVAVEVPEEHIKRHRLQARIDSGELITGDSLMDLPKPDAPVRARQPETDPKVDADAEFMAQLEALEASAKKA